MGVMDYVGMHLWGNCMQAHLHAAFSGRCAVPPYLAPALSLLLWHYRGTSC